ncbi:MAG: sigma-70 family RNA polymerase sigma factor [Bacteroidia bacterium]
MEKPPLQLLNDCRKDNRKAHFQLYKWCFDYMLQICRRYYTQEEDLKSAINLSFLHLIRSLDRMTEKYESVYFHAWVKKITIRVIIDEFRKNKKYRDSIELYDEPVNESESGFSFPAEGFEEREEIRKAILKLPEMSRTVFNLHAIEGYTHEEIAGILGISANTSKVHLFRARQKLQELLQLTKHVS